MGRLVPCQGLREQVVFGSAGESLSALRWMRLAFELEAIEPVELPEFPGSSIRGAFGQALRELFCLGECPWRGECRRPDSCAFGRIFESRRPEAAAVLSRVSHVTAAFALRAPPSGGRFEPGARIAFGVAFVGRAADFHPHAVEAVRRLEERGLGRSAHARPRTRTRGRVVLATVESREPEGVARTIYRRGAPGGLFAAAPSPAGRWTSGAARWAGRPLCIEFLTPTLLVAGGAPVRTPDFRALATALVRRSTSLSHFHCGGPGRLDVLPLLAAADGVEILSSELHWSSWTRWSGRQRRAVPMEGFVGKVTYGLVPGALLPFLAVGEELHVGKGATFGMGAYRVRPS
ncbi:MAG: CRISPR system precrRNA processing endoribonuclease RAMP protein Cas6 [Planctomycetes bacterium]|nr:CRISPR system precrRNA processing endoribonuclease RAMP protein Cas6 [Planctomycetota bacterium]